jgi:hypothetical protein
MALIAGLRPERSNRCPATAGQRKDIMPAKKAPAKKAPAKKAPAKKAPAKKK